LRNGGAVGKGLAYIFAICMYIYMWANPSLNALLQSVHLWGEVGVRGLYIYANIYLCIYISDCF